MESTSTSEEFDRVAARIRASSERIEYLKSLRKTTLLQAALQGLPRPIQRARLDCLIYFYVQQFGNWRNKALDENGKPTQKRTQDGPVYHEQRLGPPRYKRVSMAVLRVRKQCPDEAREYHAAMRRFKEARRRYMATETEESWNWYMRGDGNTWSLLYRYHIMLLYTKKNTGFHNGYFKYIPSELLSRLAERKRAHREIKEEFRQMKKWRQAIFAKMGVPPAFRSLI